MDTVILEICGIPGSGKSTLIRQLEKKFKDSDIAFDVGYPGHFYNDFENLRFQTFIKGFLKCCVNITLSPKFCFLILLEIFKQEKLMSFSIFFKLFIFCQYHLNWINYRTRLNNSKIENKIILLDGSPWNILLEFPISKGSMLHTKLLQIYDHSPSTVLIFSTSGADDSYRRMRDRTTQRLEIELYGSMEKFRQMQEDLEYHYDVLLALMPDQVVIEKLNLMEKDVVDKVTAMVSKSLKVT